MAEGLQRYPVDLLTYCLMGNHWHLVLQPRAAVGRRRVGQVDRSTIGLEFTLRKPGRPRKKAGKS